MLFNSLAYPIFFAVTAVGFFLCPARFRWILLLVASIFFYCSFIPAYIVVLFFLILVDYFCGRLIEASEGKKRRIMLGISIASNVGILFFFKYFAFVVTSIEEMLSWFSWSVQFPLPTYALPIGISFHVFQSLSYVIEVYRRNYKAERHLGKYALYVLFFPQLVAGPIERPERLLPQFHQKQVFRWSEFYSGLRLILWGYLKKCVVADRLAPLVDVVFSHPAGQTGPSIVIATVFFAFQIYGDFSGYTDIARGSARILGFSLVENFRRPYLSASLSEFWRRWHISLSSWFRDYVYIPLGGNRVSRIRRSLNVLITFLLSGLWHGADWKYVIWGGLHGVALGAEPSSVPSTGMRRVFAVVRTFAIVCLIWMFFRAQTLKDAIVLITQLPIGWSFFLDVWKNPELARSVLYLHTTASTFLLAFGSIASLVVVEWLIEAKGLVGRFEKLPLFWRSTVIAILVLLFVTLGEFHSREFIYFQF